MTTSKPCATPRIAVALMLVLQAMHVDAGCGNAAKREDVQRRFEARARRDYVGQQQAWNFVRAMLEGYVGLAPRSTCSNWVVHFTGPSGSGKSFLAEIIAEAAFDGWEEEAYPGAYTFATTAACGLGGLLSMGLGPLGWSGGCVGGAYAMQQVLPSLRSHFHAPKSFPGQCGVRQHKFGRSSGVAEVDAWEYAVAAELLRDPAAVIVVDDVGRLGDAAAFERLGQLLCGDRIGACEGLPMHDELTPCRAVPPSSRASRCFQVRRGRQLDRRVPHGARWGRGGG
jgi:hypothetical protein